jgi:hypothetical protein
MYTCCAATWIVLCCSCQCCMRLTLRYVAAACLCERQASMLLVFLHVAVTPLIRLSSRCQHSCTRTNSATVASVCPHAYCFMFVQMLTGHVLPRLTNMSHIIHKVSFGPEYPGQVNPLDGFKRINGPNDAPHAYKYYLKVRVCAAVVALVDSGVGVSRRCFGRCCAASPRVPCSPWVVQLHAATVRRVLRSQLKNLKIEPKPNSSCNVSCTDLGSAADRADRVPYAFGRGP